MLIGRAGPVARLREAVDAAESGRGGLVLVAGEAGIGKTALVTEATTGCSAVGAACWSDGAPELWPWHQVVRALGAEFPAQDREFDVFAAVTEVLLDACRDRALVVVIEDLHWADEASLRLLDFAVQHTGFARLLFIGTYRDDEVSLALKASTVVLSGLSRDEVAELVHAPDDVVDEITKRSGGNPFFVEQLARLWQGGSLLSTIPPGAAAVVERRLSRLAPATVEVLRQAAALGHEFSLSPLGSPTGLDQAVAARLIRSLGGDRYAFVHDLVRAALHSGRVDVQVFVRAGEDANRRLAWAEAARYYRHALDLADHGRAEIALELGNALHALKDLRGSREAFRIALAEADPALAARVAVTAQLLEGDHDEAARELSDTAVELARQSGEHLEQSLTSRLGSIYGLGTAAERLAITDELVRLPDHDVRVGAWRVLSFVELGDPRYLAEHQAFLAAARGGSPVLRHDAAVTEVLVATLQGRYDDARAAADTARELGEHPYLDRMHLWWLHRWSIAVRAGEDTGRWLAEMRTDPPPFLPLVEGREMPGNRWLAPMSLRLRVEAAVRSGDRRRCAEVRKEVEPFAGQWAVTATLLLEGPVDGWLARLDAATGDWEAAAARWASVAEVADRMGARPWADEARAQLDGGGTFRRAGKVWELGFAGRTAHVPDSKGLRDLHVLVGSPGADVAATVLAGGVPGADPVLDDQARAAYRRRLTELDEHMAVASDARAVELDREREALLDELRAATGLGGRSRRLGDETERARKAVTNRINDALRRLDGQHEELARHLRESITTGAACRYRPTRPISWRR
ncbi:ATP-binding protein [Lentzea terrae]|uniref:ATP-binding protein n=1 Tax=Lentzea terrae TaxID=2200761 RepID=UPI000DD4CFCE|nr:AAA family ATPase [Lentzea terrae]